MRNTKDPRKVIDEYSIEDFIIKNSRHFVVVIHVAATCDSPNWNCPKEVGIYIGSYDISYHLLTIICSSNSFSLFFFPYVFGIFYVYRSNSDLWTRYIGKSTHRPKILLCMIQIIINDSLYSVICHYFLKYEQVSAVIIKEYFAYQELLVYRQIFEIKFWDINFETYLTKIFKI